VPQRSLTYLTLLFTLLLPLLGALWARSYVYDETLYRVGGGRGVMLSCIRGELALWTGPARDAGPVRYMHESSSSGYAMTAAELIANDPTAQSRWLAGFGYAHTYAMAPANLGPVRCFAIPLWCLTLLTAALPGRLLLRRVRRNQLTAAAELARCRRCGAQLAADETRCQACSFPAFTRRGVVA